MSCKLKETTLIPCEPFEARVFDIHQAKMVDARVIGYRIAIREMASFQTPCLLTPLNTGSGARHGIIAMPAWEPIEAPILAEAGQ